MSISIRPLHTRADYIPPDPPSESEAWTPVAHLIDNVWDMFWEKLEEGGEFKRGPEIEYPFEWDEIAEAEDFQNLGWRVYE